MIVIPSATRNLLFARLFPIREALAILRPRALEFLDFARFQDA
jgi:hypothetical protein